MDIGHDKASRMLSISTVRDSYLLPKFELTLILTMNGLIFEKSKTGKLSMYKRFSEIADCVHNEFLHGHVVRLPRLN